jgi:hypothetical protein
VRARFSPVAVAIGLTLVSALGAQSPEAPPRASVAPAFSGRYKLLLTFGRGCAAAVQVGPQSVLVDVVEAPVTAGSEVSGQSISSSEPPEDVRFVLLRQGDTLHGAFGAKEEDYVGFRTLEGYRVWMRLMASGTATTSSGRAAVPGTAFGEIDLSRPGDADLDTVGFCVALDHAWSLEPA